MPSRPFVAPVSVLLSSLLFIYWGAPRGAETRYARVASATAHPPSRPGPAAAAPLATVTPPRGRARGGAQPVRGAGGGSAALRPGVTKVRPGRVKPPTVPRPVRDRGIAPAPAVLAAHPVGNIFGVGAYVAQRHQERAGALVARANQLSAGWVREEFTATRLHASAGGPYWWGPYDTVVNRERGAGLQVLGLLDYSNTWGLGDHGTMPHSSMSTLVTDYSAYAAAVAAHFRGRIRYWEIWNEPNLSLYWHPAPDAEDYAALLDAAAAAIKHADPHARIVLGGTAGMDVTFIKRVARLTTRFDVLAVHPYRSEPEANLVAEVADLKTFGKPIWFTEVGWPAGDDCAPCVPSAQQAGFLARFYLLSAAAGVDRIFWYDLADDDEGAAPQEVHFGLLKRDLTPKPAARAYAFLSRTLQHTRFDGGDNTGPNGLYVLHFTTTTPATTSRPAAPPRNVAQGSALRPPLPLRCGLRPPCPLPVGAGSCRARPRLAISARPCTPAIHHFVAIWNTSPQPITVHIHWNAPMAYLESSDTPGVTPQTVTDGDFTLVAQSDAAPVFAFDRMPHTLQPAFPAIATVAPRLAPRPRPTRTAVSRPQRRAEPAVRRSARPIAARVLPPTPIPTRHILRATPWPSLTVLMPRFSDPALTPMPTATASATAPPSATPIGATSSPSPAPSVTPCPTPGASMTPTEVQPDLGSTPTASLP